MNPKQLALCLVVISLVWGFSFGVAAHAREITLTREFVVAADDLKAAHIPLFAWSICPAGERVLSLEWEPVTLGWLPAWHLVLRSDTDLVPTEAMSPGHQGILMGPVSPVVGRTYEAVMSYDGNSGAVDVSLYDVVESTYVYRGAWTIERNEQALCNTSQYPESTHEHAAFWPVGTAWDLVTQTETGSYVSVTLIEQTKPTWVRVRDDLPGDWFFVGRGQSGEIRVPLDNSNGEGLFDLRVPKTMAGPLDAALQYWVDGEFVWEAKGRRFVVSKLAAVLDHASVNVDEKNLEVAFTINSDVPLTMLDLQLEIALRAVVWDGEQGVLSEQETATYRIPLLPVPEQGSASDGVVWASIPISDEAPIWRARLGLVSDPAVIVQFAERNIVFTSSSETVLVSSGDPQPFIGSPLEPTHPRWDDDVAVIERKYDRLDVGPNPVVFIGSSSIRGWGTLERDFATFPIVNSGFGGSHIIDSVYYVDRLVVPHDPAMVLLYAGTNDLSSRKTPTQVFADYVAFVHRVLDALPDTKVMFISIVPSPSRWAQRFQAMEANRLIELYTTTDERLGYIDVYSAMIGPDETPRDDLYISDRLHMNATGYAIWTQAIRPYLGD